MSSITLLGDTSGSIVIDAPAIAGSNTITLPTTGGTIRTTRTPGTVLQVVQATYSTVVTTQSASFSDTGLTGSITPSSTSSKILILVNQRIFVAPGGNGNASSAIQLFRNATQVWYINRYGLTDITTAGSGSYFTAMYLDSPATTSAVTYKTQFNRQNGNATVYAQLDSDSSSIVLMEIAA
jgi:hypothetical protein